MIVILNYGLGNLLSIENMIKKIRHNCLITNNIFDIEHANKIILPGVGHFDFGMKLLRESPFFEVFIRKVTNDKVPLLGICLGAQMLLEKSEEGREPGLGLIKGECKKFDITKMSDPLPIPNMGWADVQFKQEIHFTRNITSVPRYYFVHSYHMNCINSENVLATSVYGYPFAAAVIKENIYGVQFHPEKSHKFGMVVLKNFAEL